MSATALKTEYGITQLPCRSLTPAQRSPLSQRRKAHFFVRRHRRARKPTLRQRWGYRGATVKPSLQHLHTTTRGVQRRLNFGASYIPASFRRMKKSGFIKLSKGADLSLNSKRRACVSLPHPSSALTTALPQRKRAKTALFRHERRAEMCHVRERKVRATAGCQRQFHRVVARARGKQ